MVGGAFHLDTSTGTVFRQETVVRLNAEGDSPIHGDSLPTPEPMQLGRILPPGSGLYHQIGRPDSERAVFRQLTEYRVITAACGITEEELDKEWLCFSGQRVISREGMPPPVIALMRLRTEELAGISGDIVSIEHLD